MTQTVRIVADPQIQRKIDAQQNGLLQQLASATPAQIQAYMDSQVTTLAQARSVLVSLALAVRFLYLRDKS